MKIIESLVIEQQEGLFKLLSRDLPLEFIKSSRVPVYRLEINPDLVIYFYLGASLESIPSELIDHIFPHLRRVLYVGLETRNGKWLIPPVLQKWLSERDGNIPQVMIMGVSQQGEPSLPKEFKDNGLFLGDYARLLFWRVDDRQDTKRVWRTIWERFPTLSEG